MKKVLFRSGMLAAAIGMLLATGCSKKAKEKSKDPFADEKGSYFPLQQFALNQWNTFAGSPFTLVKTVRVDDKIDSSYVSADTLHWFEIFETFFPTDISDRKFLGKYNFTEADDPKDGTHNYYYEANDEDLYTKKFLVSVNPENQRVMGIYIEASESSLLNEKTLKLYYKPLKTIQIQVYEKPLFRAKKHTVIEYDFMI